jgi:phage shock protein C
MQQKRLYRSTTDKMIAGVCGGIADYFNIDPVIVRIIAVILLLPGGLPGFIPYIILWVVVPEKPAGAPEPPKGDKDDDDQRDDGTTSGPILGK